TERGTGEKVLFFVGLLATVFVTAYVTRIAKKALQQAVSQAAPPPAPLRKEHPMVETVPIAPQDIHNQTLVHNVHPADWVNPEPAPRYNLVVLGAGTAGLISAAGAAG